VEIKAAPKTRVEVKNEERGEVVAVFSTLDVIDHDGDVTLPGAFEDGAQTRMSGYNHSSWGAVLPVGRGTIREVGKEAVLEGRFFMESENAREHFTVVKGMGELQEWSYGYDVVKASEGEREDRRVRFLEKLKVHEVSPVILGAGIATRTLSAKGRERFADQLERVLAEVVGVKDRAVSLADLRGKEGRDLSDEAKGRIATMIEELERATSDLKALLTDPAAKDDEATQDIVLLELARYERTRAALSGVL